MLLQTRNPIYSLVRTMRPRQWLKNAVVFAPIIFQGKFFEPAIFFKGSLAFIFFSIIASGVYIINDINDYEKDREHPIKKNRPIASGLVSIRFAMIFAIIIFAIFIPFSYIFVGKYFGLILSLYLLMQIAYSLKLKNIIIVDALTISLGFILRVFAGALAIPLSISSWLVLAIIGTSLLLAFGKRRAERTLLESQHISEERTRSILKHYPQNLLDSMISMSASFSIITYSLFAFHSSSEVMVNKDLVEYLPSILAAPRLLMLTIPIVIYAVARYLYIIYEKKEGESPERVFMQDKPFLFAIMLWTVVVLLITNIIPNFLAK